MAVTVNDVEHIAALAKLEFSNEEKEKFTHQLNQILNYVEKLKELDTENVEPLSHVIELSNRFREDKAESGLTPEEALQNAPSRTEKFFKVPKVIGEKGS
ncbi:MAG: Asp-tRNA(Asn)/Glu-tRNA(Gln) amidotransferase subunit GatC [Ignavibacteriales bacterium]|nr:Asp-tRNA(Asn)/Glu-tRNA(Gln) amidotransferase subunit GatC [Ignavibacteriales bacterium]